MSEEPRKKKRTFVIATAIILVFVMAPFAFGYGIYDALIHLQIGTPSLSVSSQGLTFFVTLSIPIKNPSITPLPTLNAVVEAKLNDHVLFYAESKVLGSLDPGASCVVELTTCVDVDLPLDLAITLGEYLAGKGITYSLRMSFSVHLLTDVPVYSYEKQGAFKLYG